MHGLLTLGFITSIVDVSQQRIELHKHVVVRGMRGMALVAGLLRKRFGCVSKTFARGKAKVCPGFFESA